MKRGVFIVRSHFGYDVQVDGKDLGMDVSWSQANRVAKAIADGRPAGDGRGYGRCRHDDNDRCFGMWRCIYSEEAL